MDRTTTDAVGGNVDDTESNDVSSRYACCKNASVNMSVRVGAGFTLIFADDKTVSSVGCADGHGEGDDPQVTFSVTFPKCEVPAWRSIDTYDLDREPRSEGSVTWNRAAVGNRSRKRGKCQDIAPVIALVQPVSAQDLREREACSRGIKEGTVAEGEFIVLVGAQCASEDMSVCAGRKRRCYQASHRQNCERDK